MRIVNHFRIGVLDIKSDYLDLKFHQKELCQIFPTKKLIHNINHYRTDKGESTEDVQMLANQQ